MLFFKLHALTGMAEMRNSYKISFRKSDVKDYCKTWFLRHYWILGIQDALTEQIKLCIGISIRLLQTL